MRRVLFDKQRALRISLQLLPLGSHAGALSSGSQVRRHALFDRRQHQSAMSTRLKTFLDRLISLDGGFFVGADQYEQKGPEWRDKCIALATRLSSTGQLHYDARMWGRVAAYFITSKDEKNSVRTVVRNFKTP